MDVLKPGSVALTVRQLEKVFQDVKSRFTWVSDQQYNIHEYWTPLGEGEISGDCEDFALTCRALLEPMKTRLVTCWTEDGEYHCVLEAMGYVLDNRQDRVMSRDTLEDFGYRWDRISGYEPGDTWHKVSNSTHSGR